MLEVQDSDNHRNFLMKVNGVWKSCFGFILKSDEIFFVSRDGFVDDAKENGFDDYCCHFYPKQHPEIFNLITEWEKGRNVSLDRPPRSLAEAQEMMIRQHVFDKA